MVLPNFNFERIVYFVWCSELSSRIGRFNPSKCQKKLRQCTGYPGIDRAYQGIKKPRLTLTGFAVQNCKN